MKIIEIKINNALHTIEKYDGIYTVKSKFENDFNFEYFEFENFDDAKKFVDEQVNDSILLTKELQSYLLKALQISEQLNLDITEKINEILNEL